MEIKIGKWEYLEEMVQLADLVFRPKEKSMRIETPIMYSKENIENGNTFIVVENKKIVSFVGMVEEEICVYGNRVKIGEIGNVCTHPDYRGKGYASLLLEKAIEKAKNDKIAYLMISGGRNLYKRIGAVSMPFFIYEIKGKNKKTNFKIRRYRNEMYKDCIKIYQREPVRFIRKKNFSILFSLYNGEFIKKVMLAISKIYVILKDNEIVGYWAEGERKGRVTIGYNREFSGPRNILVEAWKSKKGKKQIIVPLWDKELCFYLGKEKEIREFGTVLLVNPEILIDSIKSIFYERGIEIEIFKKENNFWLKVGDEKKAFDNISEMAIFLFCSDGKIPQEGVWKDILPIPLPSYGFNYA